MSETPAPRHPGQDDDPPGVPAGPGDRPRLGSPDWRPVPQRPDWPEWMGEDAHNDDEDPGDPDSYQDPDNAPPPGLEHNIPYEAGGRSCLCNGDPKFRHCHRMKQHPRWKTEKLADGGVCWTMPSGRQYVTEPTRYPI